MTDDGLAFARILIDEESRIRTGRLDLSWLGLAYIPEEIEILDHLETLTLGGSGHNFEYAELIKTWRRRKAQSFRSNWYYENFVVEGAPRLPSLETILGFGARPRKRNSIQDIRPLRSLKKLKSLDLSFLPVEDFTSLSCMSGLEIIDCSHTRMRDLRWISQGSSLRKIELVGIYVVDFDELTYQNSIEEIVCGSCAIINFPMDLRLELVKDLHIYNCNSVNWRELSNLSSLESLEVSSSGLLDLDEIQIPSKVESLSLRSSPILNYHKISQLTNLLSLSVVNMGLKDLNFLEGVPDLSSINCQQNNLNVVDCISKLLKLRSARLNGTGITDITALRKMEELEILECSYNPIEDLSIIADLKSLRCLDASFTDITFFPELAHSNSLQVVDIHRTNIADIFNLKNAGNLRYLDCSESRVSDVSVLSQLRRLAWLDCGHTRVSDISQLVSCKELNSLSFDETLVSELEVIREIENLNRLSFKNSKVKNISPLTGHKSLAHIDCSSCRLDDISDFILTPSAIQSFRATETHVEGLPYGILAMENNLDALRHHYNDLRISPVDLNEIRLFLLGNGAAGKTQIARWLAGMPFEARWDSTHGIRIVEVPELGSMAERLRLRVWDFGGQDIYHGAHALFLRGPAVLTPVWAVKRENTDEYEHDGLTFRNHPLAYWLDVVRHAADPDCPVLVLQTQCDAPADERPAPIDDGRREALHPRELRVSPKADRRRAALEEELRECIDELRTRFGRPLIGAGRLRVRQRLEALREADAALPPEARRHRLIGRDDFEAICAEEGGVSSPTELLRYLDADGTVLHRPGLFEDRIVLDLGWALDAVYAVFDRRRAYGTLQRHGGRFTLDELGALVWREHGENERKLLLSLMLSCGMCFRYSAYTARESEAEYIAPDLLPGREAVAHRLENGWDTDLPGEHASFRYALLHGGLIRSILSEIGALAGPDAIYWRGGFYGYDGGTRSRLLIEQEMTGGWEGAIHIRAQRGQAEALLKKAVDIVRHVSERLGMKPVVDAIYPPRAPEAPPQPLTIVQEKPTMPELYVSYAWRDDASAEGRTREEQVDRLCEDASARGCPITRDKIHLGFGDDIQNFMRRIGGGDRVFVFLSDKYLRSPFCMFELSEVWRNSRREDQSFNDRVRLFTLPDAAIWSPEDRADWAIHWKKRHDALAARADEHGLSVLGESGHRDLTRMRRFYQDTADMLDALANRVQPRSFEDFVRYGFDDPAA